MVRKSGPSMDGQMSAQCSTGKGSQGKGSQGKESIGECSAASGGTHTIKYRLDNEILTEAEYEDLTSRYSQSIVDGVIGRILGKPYHGCLNVSTIASWCREQTNAGHPYAPEHTKSRYSEQLMKLAKERKDD